MSARRRQPNAAAIPHRLYTDLAAWWPLFEVPGYYEGEAASIMRTLNAECTSPPRTILELGAGGGSMATHLQGYAALTLVEPMDAMREVSRRRNRDAEHIGGDMRSLRLGRTFDAVVIHDAINYVTTMNDLIAALRTARHHLATDGVAMVVPDDTHETFAPSVHLGGLDDPKDERALRYLCWTHSAKDTAYLVDFAIMLRSLDRQAELIHDRHTFGLFSRPAWFVAFEKAGFRPPAIRPDRWRQHVFVAKPDGGPETLRTTGAAICSQRDRAGSEL